MMGRERGRGLVGSLATVRGTVPPTGDTDTATPPYTHHRHSRHTTHHTDIGMEIRHTY